MGNWSEITLLYSIYNPIYNWFSGAHNKYFVPSLPQNQQIIRSQHPRNMVIEPPTATNNKAQRNKSKPPSAACRLCEVPNSEGKNATTLVNSWEVCFVVFCFVLIVFCFVLFVLLCLFCFVVFCFAWLCFDLFILLCFALICFVLFCLLVCYVYCVLV